MTHSIYLLFKRHICILHLNKDWTEFEDRMGGDYILIGYTNKSTTKMCVGAFFGGIGLPSAVMGWAASCDDRP